MSIGSTGEIVDCEAPEGLASVIVRMLMDPQLLESMGRQARLWVAEQFDWDTLAIQARELFDSQFEWRSGNKPALVIRV
jgi:glycosyltransferase involved in cell wall biosynthesis